MNSLDYNYYKEWVYSILKRAVPNRGDLHPLWD